MPATTPQSNVFIGIDPSRQSRFNWWPSVDARREAREERGRFARARIAEREYARRLRRLAQHVGDIVRGIFNPDDPDTIAAVTRALADYERLLGPWAEAMAQAMLTDVMRRDALAWHRHGQRMGRALRKEIESAPIGSAYHQLMAEQVGLIRSIPTVAANRVHQLSGDFMLGGRRWEDLVSDILATGEVTISRANLIARTETSRAATNFTKVRAEHLGSEGYIWRTAMDADVRPKHKRLEGTYHKWTEPPVASEPGQKEMVYHAGAGPNCRCYPEPVLPGEEVKEGATPRSLAYLEAVEAGGGGRSAAVHRARMANPRLAARLAEAREAVAQLQQDIHAAARRGDVEEVNRLDELLAVTRRLYDDLSAQFDRLRLTRQ